MINPPYALWSIWKELGFLYRVFVILLGVVTVYSVFSAARIVVGVRSIRFDLNGNPAVAKKSLTTLNGHWANVRQLILTTFYLFGFVLFIGLQLIGQQADRSNGLPGRAILGSFLLNCAVAANVFFVFLILQLVQWVVGAILKSTAKRLDAPA